MSLFDPLQWVFTGMVILVVLGIVAGVGLRFYRALVGEIPPDEKEKKAS